MKWSTYSYSRIFGIRHGQRISTNQRRVHEEKNSRYSYRHLNGNRIDPSVHISERKEKMNFLDELLKEAEKADEKKRIQMSKVRCDQVLQSIAMLETKIDEVNGIAEHEQKIIAEWQQSQNGKLQPPRLEKLCPLTFCANDCLKEITPGEYLVGVSISAERRLPTGLLLWR